MLPHRMKLTTTIQILLQEESCPAFLGGAGREKTKKKPGRPTRRIEHRGEGADRQATRETKTMKNNETHMNPAALELREMLSRNIPGWARNDAITGTALDILAFYKNAWLESMTEDCAPSKTRRASHAVERDMLADRAMHAMEILMTRLGASPHESDEEHLF